MLSPCVNFFGLTPSSNYCNKRKRPLDSVNGHVASKNRLAMKELDVRQEALEAQYHQYL